MLRCLLCSLVLALALSTARPAAAGERDAWLLPTRLEPAGAQAPLELEPVAQRLEAVLRDALLDFGLQPLGTAPELHEPTEQALVELAKSGWVILPELGQEGSELRLRLLVVPQGSSVLLVQVQRFEASQLEVRSLSLLRQLLELPGGLPGEPRTELEPAPPPPLPKPPTRSVGRAVLALHSAALGGYIGYSLQRASGSSDARLTYPLVALGAGIGLGSAMIVADEWDITLGRAWFLSAAMLWPTVGFSLADQSEGPEKYLVGVWGAVGGLTLATVGLTVGHVDEGGAAFTHSGAVLGLVLGGLGQMAIVGDTDINPTTGMGWGIVTGVTLAGALATQVQTPSPTELLYIDLSAVLGGLAGAAIGTPLLVSQERSPKRDRIWLTGVMVGTVAGAGIGYWLTSSDSNAGSAAGSAPDEAMRIRVEVGGAGVPLGFGVSGQW